MLQFVLGFILCSFLAISSNGCSSSSAQSVPDPFPTDALDFGGEVVEMGKLGDGRFVFLIFEPSTGSELYVSDGTPEGTEILIDLVPGPEGSVERLVADFNGGVYFVGFTPSAGAELWFTDGTPEGTLLIEDATPGPGSSYVRQGMIDSDALYVLLNLCAYPSQTPCGSRLLTISGSPN